MPIQTHIATVLVLDGTAFECAAFASASPDLDSLLPHRALVGNPGDDWAGVGDPKERRRRQNRINQRAWRARKEQCLPAAAKQQSVDERRRALAVFANQALASWSAGNPRADHLLRLINLNFINGLSMNSSLLGLRVDWLDCCAISPIGLVGPRQQNDASLPACPPNLVPTTLQSKTPHHPWIDLFPLPKMRDNFLVATSNYLTEEAEMQLWSEIVDCQTSGASWTGLLVWGESWDPRSWEVSLPFFRRWGWLLEGCPQIIDSTMYWRRRRGESIWG